MRYFSVNLHSLEKAKHSVSPPKMMSSSIRMLLMDYLDNLINSDIEIFHDQGL